MMQRSTVYTASEVRRFIDALGDSTSPIRLEVTPAFYAELKARFPAPAYHPDTGQRLDGLGLLAGIRVVLDARLAVPWRFVEEVRV